MKHLREIDLIISEEFCNLNFHIKIKRKLCLQAKYMFIKRRSFYVSFYGTEKPSKNTPGILKRAKHRFKS